MPYTLTDATINEIDHQLEYFCTLVHFFIFIGTLGLKLENFPNTTKHSTFKHEIFLKNNISLIKFGKDGIPSIPKRKRHQG